MDLNGKNLWFPVDFALGQSNDSRSGTPSPRKFFATEAPKKVLAQEKPGMTGKSRFVLADRRLGSPQLLLIYIYIYIYYTIVVVVVVGTIISIIITVYPIIYIYIYMIINLGKISAKTIYELEDVPGRAIKWRGVAPPFSAGQVC